MLMSAGFLSSKILSLTHPVCSSKYIGAFFGAIGYFHTAEVWTLPSLLVANCQQCVVLNGKSSWWSSVMAVFIFLDIQKRPDKQHKFRSQAIC